MCGLPFRDGEETVVCARLGCGFTAHLNCAEFTCSNACRVVHAEALRSEEEAMIDLARELDDAETAIGADEGGGEAGEEAAERRIAALKDRQQRVTASRETVRREHAALAARTQRLQESLEEAAGRRDSLNDEIAKAQADLDARRAAASKQAARDAAAARKATAARELQIREMELSVGTLEWGVARLAEGAQHAPFGVGVARGDGPMEELSFRKSKQASYASFQGLLRKCASLLGARANLNDWSLVGYEGAGGSKTAILFDSLRDSLLRRVPTYATTETDDTMNARLLCLIEFCCMAPLLSPPASAPACPRPLALAPLLAHRCSQRRAARGAVGSCRRTARARRASRSCTRISPSCSCPRRARRGWRRARGS